MHFTEKDKLLLFRRDIKYVRAIAKSPVHITKETTAALLERLKLKPIVEVTPNNQVVGTVCGSGFRPVQSEWCSSLGSAARYDKACLS